MALKGAKSTTATTYPYPPITKPSPCSTLVAAAAALLSILFNTGQANQLQQAHLDHDRAHVHDPDLLISYGTFLDTYAHFRHTLINELQALDLSLALPANISPAYGAVESSTNLQVATSQGAGETGLFLSTSWRQGISPSLVIPRLGTEGEGLGELTQAFMKAFIGVVLLKVLRDLETLALPACQQDGGIREAEKRGPGCGGEQD
ncbi:hypothetical protein LTR86_002511 [Recurvomyces mirabilis]|nr:hypothetical protein LTR86_002511 [Recurvomyces mirabilis]